MTTYRILHQVPYEHRRAAAENLVAAFPESRACETAAAIVLDEFRRTDERLRDVRGSLLEDLVSTHAVVHKDLRPAASHVVRMPEVEDTMSLYQSDVVKFENEGFCVQHKFADEASGWWHEDRTGHVVFTLSCSAAAADAFALHVAVIRYGVVVFEGHRAFPDSAQEIAFPPEASTRVKTSRTGRYSHRDDFADGAYSDYLDWYTESYSDEHCAFRMPAWPVRRILGTNGKSSRGHNESP
jgi:hypothetical protein